MLLSRGFSLTVGLPNPDDGGSFSQVIGEGGVGMAYTWNASTGGWEKIGQVVGDPGAEDSNMAVGNKVCMRCCSGPNGFGQLDDAESFGCC